MPTSSATAPSSFQSRKLAALAGGVAVRMLNGACGAGWDVGNAKVKVACDITEPTAKTTVNVLAYNSAATDPFTNVLTSNCASDTLIINHPATDLCSPGSSVSCPRSRTSRR